MILPFEGQGGILWKLVSSLGDAPIPRIGKTCHNEGLGTSSAVNQSSINEELVCAAFGHDSGRLLDDFDAQCRCCRANDMRSCQASFVILNVRGIMIDVPVRES